MMEKVVNKPVLGVKPVRRSSTSSSMQKSVVSSRKASVTKKMLGVDSLHPKNITATVTKVNQTAKNVTRIFKTPVPSKFTSFDSKSRKSISSTTSSGKKPFRQNVKSSPSVRKRESGLSSSSAKPIKPRIQSSKNEMSNKTQPNKKDINQAQNKAIKIPPKSAPKRQTSTVKHSANITINKKVETAPKSSQTKVQNNLKTNNADKVIKVEKPNKIEKMNEIDNKIKIDFSKIKEIEPDVFNDSQSKIPKFNPTKIKSSDLLMKNKTSGLDIGLNVFQTTEPKSIDKKEIIDIKPPPSSIPVLEKRIAEAKISVTKKPEPIQEEPITPPIKKVEPVKPPIKKIPPAKKASTESKKSDKSDTKKPRKLQAKKPSLKTITETMIDNEKLKEAVRIAKEQSSKAAADIREKRRSNILKLIEKKKLEMRAKKKEKEQEERLITASPITTE